MQVQVIIVEDEPIEADGEKKRIQRMRCPQIAGVQVFYSAAEAAAYLNTVTDAVLALVDINMPGISGLDFMELMQKKTNIRFIVISAYDNFRYAQKAMSLGVRYYLLKPSTYDEFKNAVETALQELDRALLLSDFWLEEIGALSPEKIRTDLEQVNMTGYPVYYVLNFKKTPSVNWKNLRQRFHFYCFSEGRTILLNLAREDRLNDFLADLTAGNLIGKAAVSGPGGMQELRILKGQADRLLKLQAALRDHEIVLYEEEIKKPEKFAEGKAILNQIGRLADQQDYNSLRELIRKSVSCLPRACSLFCLDSFIGSVVHLVQKLASVQTDSFYIDWGSWRCQPDLAGAAACITDYVDRIEEAAASGKHHKAVAWAVEYFEGHLSEKPNMAVLANQMDLNYSYFSQLFKKEMGKTFSDYLNGRRMETAAEMLLQGKSVETAAREVGFSGTKSFIRAFKEYYGTPPAQWRKKNS